MDRQLLRVTWKSLGGRVFVALWGGLAVVDVSRPAGATVAAALVVVLAAACGARQSAVGAIAVAVTGWLVINGFVLHQYGELGFGVASRWILLMVLLSGLAVAGGTARRAEHR
jgi:hypothetical protein